MPKSCAVPGCRTSVMSGYSVHQFPPATELERRMSWARFCGRDDDSTIKRHSVICENHFSPTMFSARNYLKEPKGKNILRKDAVPELNSPEDLRKLGYISPPRDPPPRKRRRSPQFIIEHKWDFMDVADISDYVAHLPNIIQEKFFHNPAKTICFFYNYIPHSTIFERRLSFMDSLVPVIEVHATPYVGTLLSDAVVGTSDYLRDLLEKFFQLRVCAGLGEMYTCARTTEYVVDSFGRVQLDPIYRAPTCEYLIPPLPANRKRCTTCRDLRSKLEQRVAIQRPEPEDVRTTPERATDLEKWLTLKN